jgi:hypothetical protein
MSAAHQKFVTPRTEEPYDAPSARSEPHIARRLAATLLLLLAGCGGGSELAPEASDSVANERRTATVFPARTGLTLVEYSTQNGVLQQSTATDDGGLASFDAEIAGTRLLATTTDTGWRVPLRRSARLLGNGRTRELTPLTTIFDQLVETGLPETEARSRVYDLLASACAVTAQVLPTTAMYGDHPLDGSAREWLLAALDAYVDALGRLGLSSDTPDIDWPHLLGKHTALLAQLCDTARTVSSDVWQASARDMLADRHGLTADIANVTAQALWPQALALVLDRMADRIVWLEHPLLSATLQAQTPAWIVDPPGQVAHLIDAAVARSAKHGSVGAASMTGIALDRQGLIVQTLSGQITWANADSAPLRVVNHATKTRSVSIAINGAALDSMADLIFEALALPAEQADEPLQRRAWRYVVKASAHETPLTYGSFLHQAELYLRSVGRGFCDDVARTLSLLWQAMGYEARVWGLNGHVVPEVSVDGRWELYDPDNRTYYLNRQGQVASVADLEKDATLITSPLLRVPGAAEGDYVYLLGDLYTSTGDNSAEQPQANAPSSPFAPTIDLPPGAALEIHGAGAISVQTAEPGAVHSYKAAALKLQLPPEFTGTVQLPYVLADIAGDGLLVWAGERTIVPTQGLASSIAQHYRGRPSAGITSVDVEQVGPRGLTLTMMINPSFAALGATLSARLAGPSIEGIELSTAVP